jgi:uncharacterized membrane protein YdjX (TVP38/TMEM64 family)
MNINEYLKKILWRRFIIGLIIGGAGGFAYYYFVGCKSGTCAITSDPYISILYGMFMAGVLAFKTKKSTE